MKALITEKIHDIGIQMISEHMDLVCAYHMTMEEFLPFCIKENPDAIIIRGIPYRITRELIDSCPNLKAIAVNAIGVDNIDTAYCKEKNIPVFNVPGGSSDAVAELAFGLILNLARNISVADYTVRHEGIYNKQLHIGTMLQGKTLGIVAMGRIGSRVAKYAQAFEMKILGYDPFLTPEQMAERGAESADLERIFSESDVVFVPAPLTKDNYHMIDRHLIDLMKPTAMFVDTGRGGVVDEEALYDALKEKRIRAASMDVFEKEPPLGQPLLSLDNIVCTPHIGGSAEEAQIFLAKSCCGQLLNYLGLT